MEGGAEFPPETPLPPRPLHCWIFLGFLSQTQRAHEAKKRGRGREPEASHRLFIFSPQNTITNTNRIVRSGPLPLPQMFVARPSHTSVCLRAFPQSLIATGVRSQHTDVCEARKTVDEEAEVDRFSAERVVKTERYTLCTAYTQFFVKNIS